MSANPCLLALDQGTSSSRALVFDASGRMLALAQQELPQIYPRPGWVEHDPELIWQTQLSTARDALAAADLTPGQLAGVGITNQRETTVLWDRETGRPIHHAIVWQDRRTEALCRQLRDAGAEPLLQQRTGLRLDPYFSATKLSWLLDEVPEARTMAETGRLAFGTVDTWLLWKLTGGRTHATDITNASRTLLLDIHTGAWDDELLSLFRIPSALLPEVRPSVSDFGRVQPGLLGLAGDDALVGGVAGDQQAALFGQACMAPGEVKNTYGTGCFMLMHTGERALSSANGLISTCAARLGAAAPPAYALEGSVFMGGAVVQWLRDGLRAIRTSDEVEALAASVPDSGGVMLVPAFTGLGAPYWLPDLRGSIQGLTRGSTVAHIARAALESIAIQSAVLMRAMERDAAAGSALAVRSLQVDGGACVNDLLMQMQADLLGLPVVRPTVLETTALGAAWLAALGTGLLEGPGGLAGRRSVDRTFEPRWSRDQADARLAQWEAAVTRTAGG